MRTYYQLSAQQINIKPIQRKVAGKRFTFTQSSKFLPKPHSLDEFGQIIENKKVYQSMIKDQIRKLQAMQACIVDPQIDPFTITNDKQISSLLSKQQNKTNNKTQINKKNGLDQIDKYLDHQLDKHKLNLLYKITKKANQKTFLKLLNLYHRYTRKMKAACFFNYNYICRKIFTKLKFISNLDTNTDISITNKQEKIQNLILTHNFNIFKTSIQTLKLHKRFKVYKKTKQFRIKKVSISYMIKKFKNIQELHINYKKLLILIKRNAIDSINKKYSHKKKIINCTKILNKVYIEKQMKILIEKQRQRQFKRSKQIKNMLQKILKQRNKQIEFQQIQIKKYCKNLNLCPEYQKLILTKFKQLLITKRNQQKLLQNQKIFFIQRLQLFTKIKYMSKIYNQENTNIKNYKLLFANMLENWEYNNKFKKARAIRITKYFNQFKINIKTDRKLSESISYCLVGCRQWLINNKNIFKSQTNHKSSAYYYTKNNKNEQTINIYHALLNKTKNDLLAQQSRFKKILPSYKKKLFINKLRQLLKRKKQLQMMTYAVDMVYKNRLITKIWRTFCNRQFIKQITKQIYQQVQAEADLQAVMKINEVQMMINKLKITSFYNNLDLLKQMKMKNLKLQQNLIQKKRRNILSNLKFIFIRKQQKRDLEQKRKQYIKRIAAFSFIKLKSKLQSITHNKLKQRQILFKYNKLQDQRSSLQINMKNNKINISQFLRKLKQKNYKKQFIYLLRMHWKICKQSVTITSNYLRNKLKALKTFNQYQNQLNQIRVKKQTIRNIIKKQYLVKFAKNYELIVGMNNKIQNLNCFIEQKYKIAFFNNLSNYTNMNKKRKQTKQNLRKLKSQLKKRIFRKLQIIKALKQQLKNDISKIELKRCKKIIKQSRKQKENNCYKTEKIQVDNAIEHENTIKINNFNRQISKFEQNIKKEFQNKQITLRVQIPKQSNQFQGYQSPTHISAQQYNQYFNKSPSSDSSLFSKQSLFKQQKGKHSYQKNNQKSEKLQLSYEEYRRSMIEINIVNNQNQVQNNQNHQMQQYTQQQQNVPSIQQQNDISQHLQQNQLQNNLPYKTQTKKSHKLESQYQEEQQEQQQKSQNNNLWLQYLNNNNDEQDITNQISQSSIQFNEQYIENKYNENLCKKVFKYWKNQIQILQNYNQISRNNLPQQKSLDLLYRAWQGLNMYARQKRLAKKYLKQYEEQLHYYPHSHEEYLEFKKIAQI